VNWPKKILCLFKNKIILNFVKFEATEKDPVWIKIRIRDKHPGFATMKYSRW
jgi:hypothetical protein